MKFGIKPVQSLALVLWATCVGSSHAHSSTSGTLREVVVTATGFEDRPDTLVQGISVLTHADIQRSGVQSVPEALMKLLGIAGKVDTSGGGNYALDLRGFGETADGNQVIIVDGRRLNEADLTKADLASIPIDTVQSIEVLRGSSAVLYGEGSTAGAIVISTRSGRGLVRPNGASLVYGAGSLGTRDTRTSAHVGAGPWMLDVAAQDRSTDGYRKNFASQQNAVSATVQWSNDWMRAGAQLGNAQSRSGWPGPLTMAEFTEDASRVGSSGSLSDWGQAKSESAALFWQGVTEQWDMGADLTQRKRNLSSENFGANAYTVEGNALKLRAKRNFSGALSAGALALGMETYDWARQSRMAYGAVDTARSKTDNQAYYGLAQLRSVPWGSSVEAGYRLEAVKKTKSTYVGALQDTQRAWHLGIAQPFATDWRAFGRIGHSYRLGNIDEVFPFGAASVADLLAQTSRDSELGVAWKREATSFELRWYRHAVQHEIAYDGTSNVNLDPTEHRGLELEGRTQLSKAVTLRANAATRQNVFVEGTSAGKEIYLTPRQSAAVYADYGFAANHSLSLGVVSVSSQYVDRANTCSVPAYTTVDSRYVYRRDRLELSFAVNNVADAKYYTYAYGCTSGIYPEAGRSIQANMKYQF